MTLRQDAICVTFTLTDGNVMNAISHRNSEVNGTALVAVREGRHFGAKTNSLHHLVAHGCLATQNNPTNTNPKKAKRVRPLGLEHTPIHQLVYFGSPTGRPRRFPHITTFDCLGRLPWLYLRPENLEGIIPCLQRRLLEDS